MITASDLTDTSKFLGPRMAQIIRQATGHKVRPYYGLEMSNDELEELLEDEDVVTVIRVRKDGDGILANSSEGLVYEGDLFLVSYAKGDNGDIAVINRNRDIIAAGFTNHNGEFAQNIVAPFFVGGAKFLRYEPLNQFFDEIAEKAGAVWRKEDIIEFEYITR